MYDVHDLDLGHWTRCHALSVIAGLQHVGRGDLVAELLVLFGMTRDELAQRVRDEIARRAGGGPEAA